jgi:hypothetical protein
LTNSKNYFRLSLLQNYQNTIPVRQGPAFAKAMAGRQPRPTKTLEYLKVGQSLWLSRECFPTAVKKSRQPVFTQCYLSRLVSEKGLYNKASNARASLGHQYINNDVASPWNSA